MAFNRRTFRRKGVRSIVMVLVFVCVFGAGLTAFWVGFGMDLLRDRLVTRLQEALERPVELDGLEARVCSDVVLSVRELRVLEDGAPHSTPFLVAEQAELKIGAWELITGKFGGGTLRVGALVIGGVTYNNVRGKARLAEKRIVVKDLMAEVCGGALSGEIEVGRRRGDQNGRVPIQATFQGDSLDVNCVVEEGLDWTVPIFGRMEVLVSVSGSPDSIGLEERGQLRMREGEITNWHLLETLTSEVPQVGFVDFRRIPLHDLRAYFRLTGEKMVLDDLHVRAAGIPCRLRGSTGAQGDLNYVLDADVPISEVNIRGLSLGRTFGALFGTEVIPVSVQITGSSSDPKIVLRPRGG